MKPLCHNIYLISFTNILQSYDYLASPFIHCYLFFVVFSNKIYAPVSFKIVLKNVYSKNVVPETRHQIHKNMNLSTCFLILTFSRLTFSVNTMENSKTARTITNGMCQ